MDLNEQAQAALDRFLSDTGVPNSREGWASIARKMWFAGFGAGMDTTKALTDEAFAKIERAL